MQVEQVTCSSEDDEVHVTVVRKSGCAFAAEVMWSAEEGDALFGQHYASKGGRFEFPLRNIMYSLLKFVLTFARIY